MTTHLHDQGSRRAILALCATFAVLGLPRTASAQTLTLANPHWNITLTDAGYSDFLLDNTPGFEGREYLSGEWGAAVAYERVGGVVVSPKWLEPNFVFPDWATGSPFTTTTTITGGGVNADNLPIAQSTIANGDLEITLRYEMLDTVVGTPMGLAPASAPSAAQFIDSSRYVLKQTYTVRNISGATITNLQFFQFLHGLNAQRGVYDSYPHTGVLSNFCHDVTQSGVDPWAVSAGSSVSGLEDVIGFHASATPSAYELGYYGIEGNGVDAHGIGKPSEGVHFSVEDNWLSPPYSTRNGTDSFAPTQRWIGGVQRWNLGGLAAGQSASIDVLLSVRTGTRVSAGAGSTGGCNGGPSVPGGLGYEFAEVSSEGSCFGEYSQAHASEVALRIAEGEFTPFTFLTPCEPAQLWKVQFSGVFAGNAVLKFGYDPTLLPPGFDESTLSLYEFVAGAWQTLPSTVDPVAHTITVTVTQLSVFALGTDSLVTYDVSASVVPVNSGILSGAGVYTEGSSVTLSASASGGYAFTNWTENGSAVSTSPSYTFLALANRTVVANFVPVGAAKSVATSSQPASGGSTSGDGAYGIGTTATVHAVPNTGYKFSKWTVNGVSVSTARDFSFTVSGDAVLVAKFKPVYTLTLSADPPEGGEVEGDPAYESGELAKLKAKPLPEYSFANWTQNGTIISTDPNFQFNITGNRELVGNFAPGYRVDVSAEPYNAGVVLGAGVHPVGADVTVEAVAHPGYVFLKWTESADPVSATALYSFPSANSRVLVANFIAQPALGETNAVPGALTLTWPAGANGWVLQECADLSAPVWGASAQTPTVVGTQKQVTVSPATGTGFYRLNYP